MPMNWPIPSIIASAHVFPSVSDSLEVKYEFGKPFSFILEQVLSSGGRQAVEEIWRSDLSCIVCNKGGDTCEKYYALYCYMIQSI